MMGEYKGEYKALKVVCLIHVSISTPIIAILVGPSLSLAFTSSNARYTHEHLMSTFAYKMVLHCIALHTHPIPILFHPNIC